MTIRFRSLNLIAVLLGVFVAALAALATLGHQQSLRALEQSTVERASESAQELLEGEAERIRILAADWSWWHGLGDYLQDGTPDFAANEFTPRVLTNLRIHAFLLRQANGALRYAATISGPDQVEPMTEEEASAWAALDIYRGPARTGLLMRDGNPWLVSSQPAADGRLVFARRVDEQLVGQMASLLHLPLNLVPLARADQLDPRLQRALLAARPDRPVYVRDQGQRLLAARLVTGLSGRPALVLQVTLPPPNLAGLRLRQALFVGACGVAGLLFAVLVLLLLHRAVTARLPRLVDTIRKARQEADFRGRVDLGGSPEWVQLGSEVNGLLERMQQEHERLVKANAELEVRVAEDHLRKSEQRYQELFASMISGFALHEMIYDEAGRPVDYVFLDVNPAFCAMTGVTREQVVGRRVSEAFPGMEATWIERYGEVAATGKSSSFVNYAATLKKYFSVTAYRPRPGQFAVNFIDVTEQRQAEDRLRLQGAALESAVNAIMIVDQAGLITWVNRAFTQLTGYPADEVLGQRPSLLKSGRHNRDFYTELWKTVTAGNMWRGELVNRRKDGALYLEEMTITPVLDAEGRATHFVGIKQDITEQRNLQQQLYQAQKIDGIGRLAGGIAHDFNNLLQAITGFCTLLLEQMGPDSPYRPDVQEIDKAAKRAAALTRQLLAFSRRQMIEPRVVDLNQLVENLQKMLQRLIGEDIRLETELATNLDRVRVDPGQIEQVLVNLAINARDAMPKGGRLSITTYSLVFLKEDALLAPEARHGRFVCMALSDTGVGMNSEVLEHIFEPFYSTKGLGKGTGLGLSVVYGIVRQHDGMVHVYSEVDQGTTFRIYFPVVEETAAEVAEGPAPERTSLVKPAPGLRILLTEDESGVRDFATRALTRHGYQVVATATIAEARAAFQKANGQFDLLFTDVVLPDGDGLALAEFLLSIKPDLRVLFTSGYTDEKSRWPHIQELGLRFLQKPYPVQDLLQALHATLQDAPPAKLGS